MALEEIRKIVEEVRNELTSLAPKLETPNSQESYVVS